MIKKHKEEVVEWVEVVDAILCNCCGKDIPEKDCGHTYLGIKASWGYGSKKDLTTQSVDLCEPCWDKFCEGFVIPPSTLDHMTLENSDDVAEVSKQLELFDEVTTRGY